jgi:hypothetical protein
VCVKLYDIPGALFYLSRQKSAIDMPLRLLHYLCPRSEPVRSIVKEIPGKDRFILVQDPASVRHCQWKSKRHRRAQAGPDCICDFTHRALTTSRRLIGDLKVDLEEAFYCSRHLQMLRKQHAIKHSEKCVKEPSSSEDEVVDTESLHQSRLSAEIKPATVDDPSEPAVLSELVSDPLKQQPV